MINAVCFNLKVFCPEILDKIITETGGIWMGRLCDESQVNCIQSFTDGRLFHSFCWRKEVERNKILNCHEDVDMFIHVNTCYGNRKNEE